MIKRSMMSRTRLETVSQIKYWLNKSVDQTLFCLGTGFRRDLTRRLAGYLAVQLGVSHHTAKRKAREIIAETLQKRLEQLSRSIERSPAMNDTAAPLIAPPGTHDAKAYAFAA